VHWAAKPMSAGRRSIGRGYSGTDSLPESLVDRAAGMSSTPPSTRPDGRGPPQEGREAERTFVITTVVDAVRRTAGGDVPHGWRRNAMDVDEAGVTSAPSRPISCAQRVIRATAVIRPLSIATSAVARVGARPVEDCSAVLTRSCAISASNERSRWLPYCGAHHKVTAFVVQQHWHVTPAP